MQNKSNLCNKAYYYYLRHTVYHKNETSKWNDNNKNTKWLKKNIISLTWLTKHGHALLNRGEETFPWRTKTKELSDSSFNAFLMLPSTHHHPPPTTTAVFLVLLLATSGQARGARGGVLGVCRRLTWAQAAICHPTLASLILILSPARPSRPAVSSPQKGFLLGGVVVGALGETKAGRSCGSWGAPLLRALWPGPWPGRADGLDRQHHVCSLPPPSPPPPLSFISHTDPRGWRRDRRGGGWWANEHNEETDTDYPDPPSLPPSSIHLWVRISLFPTGRLLPSPPLPCVTPLFSVPSFIPPPGGPPHTLCGQARPYWPYIR